MYIDAVLSLHYGRMLRVLRESIRVETSSPFEEKPVRVDFTRFPITITSKGITSNPYSPELDLDDDDREEAWPRFALTGYALPVIHRDETISSMVIHVLEEYNSFLSQLKKFIKSD